MHINTYICRGFNEKVLRIMQTAPYIHTYIHIYICFYCQQKEGPRILVPLLLQYFIGTPISTLWILPVVWGIKVSFWGAGSASLKIDLQETSRLLQTLELLNPKPST